MSTAGMATVIAVLAAAAPAQAIEPYTTLMIARASDSAGGAPADATSHPIDLSRDGRHVVFNSSASNLHPDAVQDESGPRIHGFLRDTLLGETSVLPKSGMHAITPDGRFVVFGSIADELSPDDADGTYDVFLRDRTTGTTTLVSRRDGASGGPAQGGGVYGGGSSGLAVSDDGRFVLFFSHADNLSKRDNDNEPNLFVRDLRAGRTELVSPSRPEGPIEQMVAGGGISADGRFVVFQAVDNNLKDPLGRHDTIRTLVRDRTKRRTIVVDRQSSGDADAFSGVDAWLPEISGSGRYVVYGSYARWKGRRYGAVFREELSSGRRVLVSPRSRFGGSSRTPSIDATGRFVAFTFEPTRPAGFVTAAQVWLHDARKRKWHLASRASGAGGEPAELAYYPKVSPDGRHVAFTSPDGNLAADRPSGTESGYLRRVLP